MMSVVTKVALQLNCKLGGELWALEIPVRHICPVVGYCMYRMCSNTISFLALWAQLLNETGVYLEGGFYSSMYSIY